MAPSRDTNVNEESRQVSYKKDINTKTDRIIQNRKHANDIFDVIEYLQVYYSYFIVESLEFDMLCSVL